MDIISLLQYTIGKVIETFAHNWYLLLISIIISAALKLYVDQDAIGRYLRRNSKNSVLVSTAVAVATPFCSCGTTARRPGNDGIHRSLGSDRRLYGGFASHFTAGIIL